MPRRIGVWQPEGLRHIGRYVSVSSPSIQRMRIGRLAVYLGLAICPAAAQSRIEAEIQKVRKSLADRPINDPNFAGVPAEIETRSKAAADAAGAGLYYFSLERLGQSLDMLNGARTGIDLVKTAGADLPSFEKEWNKTAGELEAFRKDFDKHNWSAAPAAVRALGEAAATRTTPLLDGSRGFALTTKPADGLYYLGQVRGQMEFARFSEEVDLARKGRATPLRSFLPELQALQQKVNAAFQPPKSIDQHPLFIALNSTIKLANELDAARRYAGALYQYLEAVRIFRMMDATPVAADAQAALIGKLESERVRLAASRQDDSIAQLFFERALWQSKHPDGSPSSADEWRAVSAIAEAIVPAYEAALKPATVSRAAKGKTVELTLVRWPYT
jgi:hypothetical protein